MAPRDLDPDVIVIRLDHLDHLMGVLSGLAPRPGFLDDDVLVHEYLAVDLTILEASAIAAPELLGEFRRSVAGWLKGR